MVVFATGFTGNLRDSVRKFLETDIDNRVENYWGISSEREIKGAFVPTGRMVVSESSTFHVLKSVYLDPSLWYVGGGMGQVRFYSRFVALQFELI